MAWPESLTSKFKISKHHGNQFQAFCPAHDDKNASLSITISDDKALLFCHAGCQIDDILKTIGLTYSDLFNGKSSPVAIYQYRTADGQFSHEKLKYQTAKGKTFRQRRLDGDIISDNLDGTERIPYNYPEVQKAIKAGNPIVYVEGEKDAETAKLLGYCGTTMGGASDWKDEWKGFFKSASIIIIPDNDRPGTGLAHKVAKSLAEVCKSLKVINLPTGKDLTEWKELGGNDLSVLISETKELISRKGIPEPAMEKLIAGYSFNWNGLGLKIIIDRLKGEDEGEICVYDGDSNIHISGIKLLSVSHRTAIARTLKTQRSLDWEYILNQVTRMALADLRTGDELVYLGEQFGKEPPKYLLHPLFIRDAINTIYADRSSAKSLFAILISIILQINWDDNPYGLLPDTEERRVLYCDWESDMRITGWQKEFILRGTELEWCDIPYLRCSRSLADSVDHIKAKLDECQAGILIIDSLGMAVADDLNPPGPAFKFFSALRQLPVTPIIIAHTAKDPNSKRKTVYGNAYYENEARSIWEVTKKQEPGSNELSITLHNRKPPPFAPIHESLGFRFVFEDDKIMVEQALPDKDKSAPNEPTEMDIALAILMDHEGEPMRQKEIVTESKGKIKATNIHVVMKRLVERPDFGVIKYDNGLYLFKS